ncbi:hypothetical protein [Streptomyces flaveolus]|uniref:hypothetical protein n=1 Tax=Streptomyces flaveolus TaxID=67297 RepID=UPI0033171C80
MNTVTSAIRRLAMASRGKASSAGPLSSPDRAVGAPAKARRNRRWRVLALATTTPLAFSVLPAEAAHAAAINVTCQGVETQTTQPGLTNTVQSTTFTRSGVYSTCLRVGELPLTTTATQPTKSGVSDASCLTLLGIGSGSHQIAWADGGVSTFTFTRSATDAGGNIVITRNGTISSGRYAGGVVIEEVTYPGLVAGLADCATPQGITSLSGLVVLTIDNV